MKTTAPTEPITESRARCETRIALYDQQSGIITRAGLDRRLRRIIAALQHAEAPKPWSTIPRPSPPDKPPSEPPKH